MIRSKPACPSPRAVSGALLLLAASAVLTPAAVSAELKGRLVIAGKPAPRVTVSAMPYEEPFEEARREARGGEAPAPIASTESRPDGAFTLSVPREPGKPDRLFRIRFEGGGVVSTLSTSIWDSSETDDVGEIVLWKGAALAGRVVDSAGSPVGGAEVVLAPGTERGVPTDELTRLSRKTTTAADGTFRVDGASAAGNTVTVFARGFAPGRAAPAKSGALSRPIALAQGTAVAGVVERVEGTGKGARRRPAAGALVRVEGSVDTRWVETKPDGTFEVSDAPSGRVSIVADGGEQGYGEVSRVNLPLAEGKRASVTLRPPAGLEGRALDAASGQSLARVKVVARDRGALRLAKTGPDGRYRLRPLTPGSWRVTADEPRYAPLVRDGVSLASGEARKLDLPLLLGATLVGHVVDENGAPVAGAEGRLAKGARGGLAGMLRRMRSVEAPAFRSGPDGGFKAARLEPGENVRLTVSHPEFDKGVVAGLALTPGATKRDVAVVLHRGVAVTGIVRDANGQPIVGADVEVNNSMTFRSGRGGMLMSFEFAGGPGTRPRTTTDADGRFQLRGISPGDYSVSAQKAGYAREVADPVKVTAETATPIELTLSAGATIRGIVKKKDGTPAEGFFVSAAASGRARRGPAFGAAREPEPTDATGTFTVEDLKAGETYDLQLFGSGGIGPQKKGVVAPADGVEVVVSGTGRIAGTAVDAETGAPLTEFTVTSEAERSGMGGGMVFRMARAGGRRGAGDGEIVRSEDGSFVLEDVPPGTRVVTVQAKGYRETRVGGIVVEEGTTKEGVEVKVARGAALRGRVTDARSGRPVPGVEVTAAAPGEAQMMMVAFDTDAPAVTDGDGRFEFDALSAGKYTVSAKHPDYAAASELVEVAERGGSVELKLGKGGVLAGTVFSEARQALAGAEVSIAAAGDGSLGRFGFGDTLAVTTDATGRFRADHLSPGRYTVTAGLRGKSSSPLDAVLQSGESKEDLVLTLAAGATLKGTVSGLSAEHLGGVSIIVNGADAFFASTRTKDDGSFEIADVPVGTASVRASAGDFMTGTRSAAKQVTVAEGQTEVVADVVFEGGFTLSGRVTKGSQAVSDAFVNANVLGGGGRAASARTDENGAYKLEGLSEGSYRVTASSSSFTGAKSQTVAVKGDQSLDFDFPSARLSGTVVEAGSRRPLADAVIELGVSEGNPFFRTYSTDSNGRFSLEELEPKTYSLTVRKADFLFEKRDVAATEQGTSDLVIELQRGEGIGVVARDGVYGVPLRGLFVRVTDALKTNVFTGPVSLDSEGRGEIPSVKPGVYSLWVEASGYAPQTIGNVRAPAPALPIALTPGGNLEVKAGPSTLSSGSYRFRLLKADGTPYQVSFMGLDGVFNVSTPVRRVENVATGSYTLAVEGGPTKPVTIREGGTETIELP